MCTPVCYVFGRVASGGPSAALVNMGPATGTYPNNRLYTVFVFDIGLYVEGLLFALAVTAPVAPLLATPTVTPTPVATVPQQVCPQFNCRVIWVNRRNSGRKLISK